MKLLKALAMGGPVGLIHAAREAWIANRITHISAMLDRERALHRANTANLRGELNQLAMRQVRATQRASAFWRSLS
jgi:hypothetical protein